MALSRDCNNCIAWMVLLSSGFHGMGQVGRDSSGSIFPTSLLEQGDPRALCIELHPDGSWTSPVRETPQPLGSLFQCTATHTTSSSMGRTHSSYFHDVDIWTWLSPIIPWCWIFITFGLHTRWLFVANSFSLSESSTWNKFTIPPSKNKTLLTLWITASAVSISYK